MKIQCIHSQNENEKKKPKSRKIDLQSKIEWIVSWNQTKQTTITLKLIHIGNTIEIVHKTKLNKNRIQNFKTELDDELIRGIKLPGARVWIGESAGPVWLGVQTRAADLCSILASSTGETNSVKLRFTWFHLLIAVSVGSGQKKAAWLSKLTRKNSAKAGLSFWAFFAVSRAVAKLMTYAAYTSLT